MKLNPFDRQATPATYHPNSQIAPSQSQSSPFELEVKRELLRQCRHSFNLALGITAASSLMALCGLGLLYFNKLPEASLTASAGILGSVGSVQFAQTKKEELRQILEEFPG